MKNSLVKTSVEEQDVFPAVHCQRLCSSLEKQFRDATFTRQANQYYGKIIIKYVQIDCTLSRNGKTQFDRFLHALEKVEIDSIKSKLAHVDALLEVNATRKVAQTNGCFARLRPEIPVKWVGIQRIDVALSLLPLRVVDVRELGSALKWKLPDGSIRTHLSDMVADGKAVRESNGSYVLTHKRHSFLSSFSLDTDQILEGLFSVKIAQLNAQLQTSFQVLQQLRRVAKYPRSSLSFSIPAAKSKDWRYLHGVLQMMPLDIYELRILLSTIQATMTDGALRAGLSARVSRGELLFIEPTLVRHGKYQYNPHWEIVGPFPKSIRPVRNGLYETPCAVERNLAMIDKYTKAQRLALGLTTMVRWHNQWLNLLDCPVADQDLVWWGTSKKNALR
jgi:hypothetical protein